MRLFILTALLLLAISMSGCGRQRTVAGDYKLEQWKDLKTYYLHKRGQDDTSDGGSIIAGTVLRLGWNNRYILVERHAIYRGDADGWMIIDVQTGAMIGPLTKANLRTHAEVQGIQIYEVGDAWKKL